MKKYAVMDIGSNSVRLMLVADGKVLYKRLQTTRLGEGLAKAPCLQEDAIERTAAAVAAFAKVAQDEGVTATYAFATAAVRTATNADAFLSRVRTLCGLYVDVVSGDAEAELGILGALGNADGGLLDVGGASAELVVRQKGVTVYKKSVDVGVVRLKDRCGRDKKALEAVANEALRIYGTPPSISTLTAIGGTATTIAALYKGLTKYDAEAVTGTKISVNEMEALADKLLGMEIEEIAAMPCMPKGRADVLAGGVLLIARFMRAWGVETLVVSDRDNLEGYAIQRGLL